MRLLRHSLLMTLPDTSEGGPVDVLLQENLSALLQESLGYIVLNSNYPNFILLQENGASLRQEDGSSYILT